MGGVRQGVQFSWSATVFLTITVSASSLYRIQGEGDGPSWGVLGVDRRGQEEAQ